MCDQRHGACKYQYERQFTASVKIIQKAGQLSFMEQPGQHKYTNTQIPVSHSVKCE